MHSSLKTDFAYNGANYAAGTDEQQIALGDNFLSKIVPLIESSQAFRNDGLIVTWTDETEGSSGCGSAEFTLAEIVISPLANGNAYTNSIAYAFLGSEDPAGDFGVVGPTRLSSRRGLPGAFWLRRSSLSPHLAPLFLVHLCEELKGGLGLASLPCKWGPILTPARSNPMSRSDQGPLRSKGRALSLVIDAGQGRAGAVLGPGLVDPLEAEGRAG
jgi:hypothetical protein